MWYPNPSSGMKDLSLRLLECCKKMASTASPPWRLPPLKTQPCPRLCLLPEWPIPKDWSHWGPALSISCFIGTEFSLCPILRLLPHLHKCSSWQHLHLIRCYMNLYPRELGVKFPINFFHFIRLPRAWAQARKCSLLFLFLHKQLSQSKYLLPGLPFGNV